MLMWLTFIPTIVLTWDKNNVKLTKMTTCGCDDNTDAESFIQILLKERDVRLLERRPEPAKEEVENVAQNPPRRENVAQNPPRRENVAQNPPRRENVAQNPPRRENVAQNPPRRENVAQNPPRRENVARTRQGGETFPP
ncbi:hypothetical protein Hamer_G007771 [Homarus americanus]|uniref:Uncharacterized protein n=1 Tax=Homarus americanus TaxID=6706 RepID=A0A8J5JMD7_HOMAM|nr:hypothetical protein Hamer_G007771 [Homarus americanus]